MDKFLVPMTVGQSSNKRARASGGEPGATVEEAGAAPPKKMASGQSSNERGRRAPGAPMEGANTDDGAALAAAAAAGDAPRKRRVFKRPRPTTNSVGNIVRSLSHRVLVGGGYAQPVHLFKRLALRALFPGQCHRLPSGLARVQGGVSGMGFQSGVPIGGQSSRGAVACMAIDRVGSLLATGGADGVVAVYDLDEYFGSCDFQVPGRGERHCAPTTFLQPLFVVGTSKAIATVCWNSANDDELFVSYAFDGSIHVFNIEHGLQLAQNQALLPCRVFGQEGSSGLGMRSSKIQGGQPCVVLLDLHGKGLHVVAGGSTGVLRVWKDVKGSSRSMVIRPVLEAQNVRLKQVDGGLKGNVLRVSDASPITSISSVSLASPGVVLVGSGAGGLTLWDLQTTTAPPFGKRLAPMLLKCWNVLDAALWGRASPHRQLRLRAAAVTIQSELRTMGGDGGTPAASALARSDHSPFAEGVAWLSASPVHPRGNMLVGLRHGRVLLVDTTGKGKIRKVYTGQGRWLQADPVRRVPERTGCLAGAGEARLVTVVAAPGNSAEMHWLDLLGQEFSGTGHRTAPAAAAQGHRIGSHGQPRAPVPWELTPSESFDYCLPGLHVVGAKKGDKKIRLSAAFPPECCSTPEASSVQLRVGGAVYQVMEVLQDGSAGSLLLKPAWQGSSFDCRGGRKGSTPRLRLFVKLRACFRASREVDRGPESLEEDQGPARLPVVGVKAGLPRVSCVASHPALDCLFFGTADDCRIVCIKG